MRVFVLGAGASAHAGYPMMAQLGEELVAWADRDEIEGPRYRRHLRELSQRFGTLENFEHILTSLHAELASGKIILNAGEAISWFFNSIRDQPAQLYDRLAQEQACPGDLAITFNYDLAVERSLRSAGLWEVFDGYGAPMAFDFPNARKTQMRVLKLHGSTNWWGPLFGGSTGYGAAHDSIGVRPVLYFEHDFEYLGCRGVRDPRAPRNCALIKTGSMIVGADKQFYAQTAFGREREDFWGYVWHEAEQALRAADKIVIIGYSLPSVDKRARELLLRHIRRDATITVCCHNQSRQIADEFRARKFSDVIVPNDPTFAGWLDNCSFISENRADSARPNQTQRSDIFEGFRWRTQ